ncbi:MAG: hypothetical protein AAGF88_07265 [Pseudomonadota bacterium]
MSLYPDISACRDLQAAFDNERRQRYAWSIAWAAVTAAFLLPAVIFYLNPLVRYSGTISADETASIGAEAPGAEDGASPASIPERRSSQGFVTLDEPRALIGPFSPPRDPETEALDEAEAADEPIEDADGLVKSDNAYQANLYFAAAGVLYIVVSITVLAAQRRVIRRHASIFWDREVAQEDLTTSTGQPHTKLERFLRGKRSAPPLYLALWLPFGMLLSATILALIPEFLPSGEVIWWHLCQFLPPPETQGAEGGGDLPAYCTYLIELAPQAEVGSQQDTPEPLQPGWRDYLRLLGSVFMAGMTFAAIAITVYGTQILAWNFPPVRDALKIRDTLTREIRRDHANRLEARASGPKETGSDTNPLNLPLNEKLKDQGIAEIVKHCAAPTELIEDKIAQSSRMMSAEDLGSVVRLLSRGLLLLMLLALVTMSLGTPPGADVAETDKDLNAIVGSQHAWLMVMGMGFSVSLGICYVIPMMRLNPYIEVEQTAAADKTAWQLEDAADQQLVVKQVKIGEDPAPFPDELTYYLGANRTKFTNILSGSRYGGGFHMVLEAGLLRQMIWLAGILAPTVAAGVLAAAF